MLIAIDVICEKCGTTLVGSFSGKVVEVSPCSLCLYNAKEDTAERLLERIKNFYKKGGDKT